MSNSKNIELVDCGPGDMSEEKIRAIASATKWEGDMRVNFTTAINALNAAIHIIDEYGNKIDEMFESGYDEGFNDGFSIRHKTTRNGGDN